jgi:hypothetical protein
MAKMKRLCAIMFFFCLASLCQAQDLAYVDFPSSKMENPGNNETNNSTPMFVFDAMDSIPDVEFDTPESHYLGALITKKWNTFLANYTHEYSVSVGFSDSGFQILKPAIYNAVCRVDRYVKRCVKKNAMSHEQAVLDMSYVLDCANVMAFEQNTQKFEQAASLAHEGEQALQLFKSVKLLNY